MSELFPWTSIALSAAMWFRTRKLAWRLEDLEFELSALRRQLAAEPEASAAAAIAAEPPPQRPLPPPLPPLPAIVRPEPMSPPRTPGETWFERLIRGSGGWEALIGGNLLNKLGALVSVIGIALFLGYSFAHMGPMGRAATGTGISLSLLAGGAWWERQDRYRIFARGLLAAGWASLYFTTFAMHALESARVIESSSLGAALMTAVASAMVAHSLRYRVQTLTGLSFGCIFAALAIGESNRFSAVAVLPAAAAMLYLAHRFEWHGLALFGTAATYATFLFRPTAGTSLLSMEGMLFLYWAIFESFDIIWPAAGRPLLFGLNALAGLGASAAVWYRMSPGTMPLYCTLAAIAYGLSSATRLLRGSILIASASMAISACLGALAIFAHLQGIWIPLGTAIEAELLFALWLLVRLPAARALALSLFGIAIGQAFTLRGSMEMWGSPVHAWAPPLAVMVLLFCGNRRVSKGDWLFSYLAVSLSAVLMLTEIPPAWTGFAWFVSGAILLELGFRKNRSEFRHQAYALMPAGWAASITADRSFVYAAATAIAITTAIRAARSFPSLAPWERRVLRLGGSVAAVVFGAILSTRFVSGPYDAIAMLTVSMAFFELGLRGLPFEIRRPAIVLNGVSLTILLVDIAGRIAKFPPPPVWLSLATASLLYGWITVRTLHDRGWFRRIAPWVALALAMVFLWAILPDPWVPATWSLLALAITETRLPDIVSSGRLAAFAPVFLLAGGEDRGLSFVLSGILTAGIQQWISWRHRGALLSAAHSWTAAAVVAVMLRLEWPGHWLALWSAFGLALSLGARDPRFAAMRWQGAALALLALPFAMFGSDAIWQRAAVSGWLAVAGWIEERNGPASWLRGAFTVAAAGSTCVTLFREVSGGTLTISWGLEATLLLAAGFLLRDRTPRLAGLSLLLLCIGKAFVYDLRHLETVHRILSFAGLGGILLAVSWIYTRFQASLDRYLRPRSESGDVFAAGNQN